jgi:hypothetical protein
LSARRSADRRRGPSGRSSSFINPRSRSSSFRLLLSGGNSCGEFPMTRLVAPSRGMMFITGPSALTGGDAARATVYGPTAVDLVAAVAVAFSLPCCRTHLMPLAGNAPTSECGRPRRRRQTSRA